MCYGSASHHLGLLALTLGHLDDSQAHFEAAIVSHLKMGARAALVHTQVSYAAMLLERAHPGDQQQALEMAKSARAAADKLGMNPSVREASDLEKRAQGMTQPAQPGQTRIAPEDSTDSRAESDSPPDAWVDNRKLNCLLFVDVADASRMVSELGDRAWRDLLHRVHGIVRQQVTRLGAQDLEEHEGGFIATFAQPSIAIGAGIAIRNSLTPFKVTTKAGVYAPEHKLAINSNTRELTVQLRAHILTAGAPGEIVLLSSVMNPTVREKVRPIGKQTFSLNGVQTNLYLFRVEESIGLEDQLTGPKR
jgi:hypothetical protein